MFIRKKEANKWFMLERTTVETEQTTNTNKISCVTTTK